jgi:t-SNARE complex subunit (syntaxin)
MGSTIIQEIQVELNSEKGNPSLPNIGDRGLAELVVLFNLMEKNLVQEEQEDSEKLQENAEKRIP